MHSVGLAHEAFLHNEYRFDELGSAGPRPERDAAAPERDEDPRGDRPTTKIYLFQLSEQPVELAERLAPLNTLTLFFC
jgi:hypothetical protein